MSDNNNNGSFDSNYNPNTPPINNVYPNQGNVYQGSDMNMNQGYPNQQETTYTQQPYGSPYQEMPQTFTQNQNMNQGAPYQTTYNMQNQNVEPTFNQTPYPNQGSPYMNTGAPYQSPNNDMNMGTSYQSPNNDMNMGSPYQSPNNDMNMGSPYQSPNNDMNMGSPYQDPYNMQNQAPYQQPGMNDPYMNPAYQNNNINLSTMPRKKTPKWIFGVIGGVAALAIIAVALFFILPNVNNTFALALLSPEKYYNKVEKEGIDESIDKLTDYYGKSLAITGKSGNKNSSNINIKATLDSSIASSLGLSDINSIALNSSVSVKESGCKYIGTVQVSDKSLLNIEVYADMDNGKVYVKIPELSDDFITTSLDANAIGNLNITQNEISKLVSDNPVTPEFLNKTLKKYSHIVVGNFNNVSLSKKVTATASNVSNSYTKITVDISTKELFAIAKEALNEAKGDKDLKKLICTDLATCTESEYLATIEDALTSLKSYEGLAGSAKLAKMHVWVDNKGNIVGREFAVDTAGISFGYLTTTKGKESGFSLWATQASSDILRLEGTSTDTENGSNGNLAFTVNAGMESISFNADFEGVKYDDKKENSSLNGKFTFSLSNVPDFTAVATFTGDGKKQDVSIEVQQNGTSLANITVSAEETAFTDFEMPTGTSYDAETQMDAYMESADMDGFLASLQTNFPSLYALISTSLSSNLPTVNDDTWNTDLDENTDDSWDSSNSSSDDSSSSSEYQDADYDSIMTAGVASNAIGHYKLDGSKATSYFDKTLTELYGTDYSFDGTSMSNRIYNSEFSEEPYTYYETYYSWTNSADYSRYVTLTCDTVSNEISAVLIHTSTREEADKLMWGFLNIVEGKVSKADKESILSALKTDNFYTFNDSSYIYLSEYDDGSCYLNISSNK